MLGRELAKFCAQGDVQAAGHPELRAELAFGLENSRGVPTDDVLDNLRHFREQDEEWHDAEQDIIALRETNQPVLPPGTEQLAAAAKHEVAAIDAAWQADWPRAIDEAGKVLAALAGGPEIRRYQALWHYIQASWAIIATRSGADRRALADAHFADARAAATGTRWLAELTTSTDKLLDAPTNDVIDPIDAAAVNRIVASPLRTRSAKTFARLTPAEVARRRATSRRGYGRHRFIGV